MQPKVSMVIPCYNKEKYIAGMFDSVLAQEWDNIELILVNDGSTDRTREIITEYEAKFLARGYEVVIVDQENRGLPGAVYSGLLRITGEFVCQVDADDELDPRYVSAMAGWLWENPEYEWAVCDAIKDSGAYFKTFPEGEHEVRNLEKWLQWKIRRGVTVYLVRKTYFDKCDVAKLYYPESQGSQEAQFLFPLVLGGGKLKYIELPLYKYNISFYSDVVEHHSKYNNYDSAKKRWIGFMMAIKEVIYRMPFSEAKKQRLCAMSEINYTGMIIIDALTYGNDQNIEEANGLLREKVIEYFRPADALGINWESLGNQGPILFAAAENNIVGVNPKKYDNIAGRVIAWGAMGQYGVLLLDLLRETLLEPTELWDLRGDDNNVKKPNVASLMPCDTVLVLTRYGANSAGIVNAIKGTGCNIIASDDIAAFLAALKFPQFYDGSVTFTKPKEATMLNNEYFLWGAGVYGRRLIKFAENDLSFKGVIDNDPAKQGTVFYGVPVISYEQAREHLPETKIVVALSLPTEVREFLDSQGYVENTDYYLIPDFVARYYWCKNKLVAKTINLTSTTICNMKCEYCQTYIPYGNNPRHFSMEAMKTDIDLAFTHIDVAVNINICSGESFLNPILPEFALYVCDNYTKRYFELAIMTNGTIIPSDEAMSTYAETNTIFSISDYDGNEKNRQKLVDKCNQFGVNWYFNRQAKKEIWHDFGNPNILTESRPDKLAERYRHCFIPGAAVYEGWLYLCAAQAWSHAVANAGEREPGDVFDLREPKSEKTRDAVYKIISRQPDLGYISHCMRCYGTVPVLQQKGKS